MHGYIFRKIVPIEKITFVYFLQLIKHDAFKIKSTCFQSFLSFNSKCYAKKEKISLKNCPDYDAIEWVFLFISI